jgi:hypothetical protein
VLADVELQVAELEFKPAPIRNDSVHGGSKVLIDSIIPVATTKKVDDSYSFLLPPTSFLKRPTAINSIKSVVGGVTAGDPGDNTALILEDI